MNCPDSPVSFKCHFHENKSQDKLYQQNLNVTFYYYYALVTILPQVQGT